MSVRLTVTLLLVIVNSAFNSFIVPSADETLRQTAQACGIRTLSTCQRRRDTHRLVVTSAGVVILTPTDTTAHHTPSLARGSL